MFASICSFTKNDPLCMAYHPYGFVGEVLLHPVYSRGLKFLHVIYENFDRDLTHGFFLFRISINILFLPNSEKLGSSRYLSASPTSRVSFRSVTDQPKGVFTSINYVICLDIYDLSENLPHPRGSCL